MPRPGDTTAASAKVASAKIKSAAFVIASPRGDSIGIIKIG